MSGSFQTAENARLARAITRARPLHLMGVRCRCCSSGRRFGTILKIDDILNIRAEITDP
jgi:hypothetical protein